MIQARNEKREGARILHDMGDLLKENPGTLWRESPLEPRSVGRDGGNPCYVVATGSGRKETAYVAFCIDDGTGYAGNDEFGMFHPSEHALTFPLTEVTDGTTIVIGNPV